MPLATTRLCAVSGTREATIASTAAVPEPVNTTGFVVLRRLGIDTQQTVANMLLKFAEFRLPMAEVGLVRAFRTRGDRLTGPGLRSRGGLLRKIMAANPSPQSLGVACGVIVGRGRSGRDRGTVFR